MGRAHTMVGLTQGRGGKGLIGKTPGVHDFGRKKSVPQIVMPGGQLKKRTFQVADLRRSDD
jgi:hypothetical protein